MITDIRLQNFRSYRDDSFEFDDGVNIIVGPNASGKTNLLEAILLVARGSSYRGRDSELVRHGAAWTRLDAHANNSTRSLKLTNEDGRLRKQFMIDDHPYRRLSLAKSIPVVLFEPNHLQLLGGGPEGRREFIDDLLEQLVPAYGLTRRQYQRALSQRNSLLKQGHQAPRQLFVWNVRLSDLGGQLIAHRQELITKINQRLSSLYRQLSHSKLPVRLEYKSSCPGPDYSSQLLHQLEAHEQLDLARGFTGHGPHRDDLVIWLGDKLAAETASRGETRTLVMALKIMELELLEPVHGRKPLLLLDDVFSELDGARRQALTKAISGYQTFITTTDADVVVQHFLDNCHIVPLGS